MFLVSKLRNIDVTRSNRRLGYWTILAGRALTWYTVNKGTRSSDTVTDCQFSRAKSEQRVNRTIKCPFHEVLSNFYFCADETIVFLPPRLCHQNSRYFLSFCPHRYTRGAILHVARNSFINALVNKSSAPLSHDKQLDRGKKEKKMSGIFSFLCTSTINYFRL